MPIYECNLFLCKECREKSGNGFTIAIRYSNTGGYSPVWEGRLCVHLTPEEILNYLRPKK